MLIEKYFKDLDEKQIEQLNRLPELYAEWNDKINVISRKDIENITLKHILHSLAIAKFIHFKPGTKILDVGTGGGFPGIPLAILFPDCRFHLVDSIAKKINVVNEVASAVGLQNVLAEQKRAEKLKDSYDFIISRAVTAFPEFLGWIRKNISKTSFNAMPNGIIYLKGGDLSEELANYKKHISLQNISDYFDEEFFDTKKIVYFIP